MLRAFQFFLLLSAIAQSLQAQVTIEGKVQLPEPTANFGFNQRYSTNADLSAPASNPPAAVVYLEGDFSPVKKVTPEAPAVMAQKNMAFAPDLLAVPVGGSVIFPNHDDMYHNVFSYSKAKRFDLGRYRKAEKSVPVVFDKPGVVTIHCEIHEAMRGTVLVLQTPYFVKTDSAGRYRLEGLPAGRFVLTAWVEGDDVRTRPVELKAGVTEHVDFPAR